MSNPNRGGLLNMLHRWWRDRTVGITGVEHAHMVDETNVIINQGRVIQERARAEVAVARQQIAELRRRVPSTVVRVAGHKREGGGSKL